MKTDTEPASGASAETLERIADFFDDHGDGWRSAYTSDTERWCEYYPLRIRERLAIALIKDETKGTAVDLGCGNGHALIRMKQLGFQRVIGVDISEEMLSAARQLVAAANLAPDIELIKADVQCLSQVATGSVSACTALGVIEYLDEDGPLLEEIHRILKPNGAAVIQTRNRHCMFVRAQMLWRRLRSRPTNKIPHRKHAPRTFRRQASQHGFRVERQRFAHFYALFPLTLISSVRRALKPIDSLLSKQCERFGTFALSKYFASMYIVKLRKIP